MTRARVLVQTERGTGMPARPDRPATPRGLEGDVGRRGPALRQDPEDPVRRPGEAVGQAPVRRASRVRRPIAGAPMKLPRLSLIHKDLASRVDAQDVIKHRQGLRGLRVTDGYGR